ncbi:hypothetical protein EON76_01305 [bacterium]|nr:MAG: hypothetical protein EON76_01305 [bacterium]
MPKSKLQSKEARVSRKQQELLAFIISFIKANNYGPSYREIMRELDYKSVSTVAVHVDSLVTKGYLRKTDNSARSLEIVSQQAAEPVDNHQKWLQRSIAKKLADPQITAEDALVLQRTRVLFGIESPDTPQ